MDRIDLQLLNLLRQRTRVSEKIGQTKIRHGLDIYVPGRERELLARVRARAKGALTVPAVTAIYREILSASRAAQGQPPIGVLASTAEAAIASARSSFGACDHFVAKKSWRELALGLKSRKLALSIVTGEDLLDVVESSPDATSFTETFAVVGEISPLASTEPLAGTPLFIITPRSAALTAPADRLLILIECKPALNAVKTLLKPMADRFNKAELCARSTGGGTSHSLVRLATSTPFELSFMSKWLQVAAKPSGLKVTILGIYPGSEIYGG